VNQGEASSEASAPGGNKITRRLISLGRAGIFSGISTQNFSSPRWLVAFAVKSIGGMAKFDRVSGGFFSAGKLFFRWFGTGSWAICKLLQPRAPGVFFTAGAGA
jgi:hypothetical protein